ncbi:MAG TPA: magnesium-translocating P-type ATPase, partial [Planctomycetota bacterium]|nr:magnesium-translocating P-type ATPase [Planctomycetota bacterium]
DLVALAAGDMVPADLRLLSAKDLFVSQAVLTGEAMPVEKSDVLPAATNEGTIDLPALCLMGTNVVTGTATGVVMGTGRDTYFGSLARGILGHRAMTSFDVGVNNVSWLLIRFMAVMVPIVFILNGVTKHDWSQAFFFGLSVAVGLVPEMLPLVVTANLARGAVRMSGNKVIVKKLNAIQNFGALDVLCTDKTGTLTQDRVILEKHLDVVGDESYEVLRLAYLNSVHQTGLKNLLDRALLEHAEIDHENTNLDRLRKVDEIPFDFMRRRMSVVVEQEDGSHLLICKGAVEEIARICSQARIKDEVGPMTEKMAKHIARVTTEMNEDGMRVIAVGSKVLPPGRTTYTVKDEADLVLAGYIGFLDPPKETAADAIEALAQHGVTVKVLTGDNPIVTRKVCRDVNLSVTRVVLGDEIDGMADDALAGVAEEANVFAKLNPLQKSRVVKALQRKGHTVGFLGDGINDAPALREADVGVSVDTGADIAKESADIILLEKSLLVLEQGVVEGRTTFGNIVKYIKMTASSNYGNVLSVLVASAFIPFLPMLPIHLLILNLLYDISQLSIPWDRMDHDFLVRPRRWNAPDIGRFMVCMGPISSIFDISTFCLLWWIFGASTPERASLFQSGWFVESLLSQTLIVHMIRTQKIPFIQSTAAPAVMLLTATVMAIGIALPFTPIGARVGLRALPLAYFGWVAATLLGYCTVTQVVKRWYLHRFSVWL